MYFIGALLAFLNITLAYSTPINLFIDYYKYRGVSNICMLNCDHYNFWSKKFVKLASENSITVSKVNIDLTDIEDNLDNCLQKSFSTIGIILNGSCKTSSHVLYRASENMLLDAVRKWVIFDEFERNNIKSNMNKQNITTTNYISEVLANLNISIDADIIIATQFDSVSYVLQDVYNHGKIQGGDLVTNEVGTWNSKEGLHLNMKGFKYYQRWNFLNWSMRMIAVISPVPDKFDPKMLTDRVLNSKAAAITKTSAIIMHEVAQIHNFRFTYTITDRWISDFNKNSSRVVANSLYFREQDVSPIIRFLPNMHDKIDVIQPYLTTIDTWLYSGIWIVHRSRYFYRIPTFGPGRLENEFLRPFSTGAWISIAAVLTLCAFILLFSSAFECRPFKVQYAVFSIIATVCQQFFEDSADSSENQSTRSSSARKLTVLVTGISCVLLYNYYTSSVVSWLLSGPPASINSLEELLDSPLELIYEDIGYTRSWLQTSSFYYNKRNAKIEDELRQNKVFNKKKDAPLLVPLEEGIAMVKAGGYAYHTEVNSANAIISKTFSQSELCEIGSLQSIGKTPLYPCLQKNSPYKEFYSWSLMQLTERGIVSCIQQRTSAQDVQCEGSSPRALALGGAAPAFLLLLAGCVLATVFLIFERLYTRHTRKL